jgi:hypothetical protein
MVALMHPICPPGHPEGAHGGHPGCGTHGPMVLQEDLCWHCVPGCTLPDGTPRTPEPDQFLWPEGYARLLEEPLMQPLCNAPEHAHIGRHRDCLSCGLMVACPGGSEAPYVTHAWECRGRRG